MAWLAHAFVDDNDTDDDADDDDDDKTIWHLTQACRVFRSERAAYTLHDQRAYMIQYGDV